MVLVTQIHPESSCGPNLAIESKEENIPNDCFYKMKWTHINKVSK